jgi:4-hydroxy-tetrahydrodipicolinate reductase
MPYKVIVWGTGFVGKMVIRELLDHPDYEIVGVIVNAPEKDGVDVGELIGRAPIGLRAATDVQATLAGPADAVAYFGPTAAYAAKNIDNMSRALAAGKNVVDTSMTPLVYPKACPRQMLEPLEKACQEGGTSCFTTGIDPGFANDLLPMTLMGLCGRVDRVRIQEILDYSTYPGDYSPMGLGDPMEQKALLEEPKVLIFSWGHTVPMIADAIGVELEKIDTLWEKWATPERIEFPHGTIEPGHCAAIRFEIRGWVGGEPRIILEHCNRIAPRQDGRERRLPGDRGGQPEHRAGDDLARCVRRRSELGWLPLYGHARDPRDPRGVCRAPWNALGAGPAPDPGAEQHAPARRLRPTRIQLGLPG